MATFQLKKGADIFDLDTAGAVAKGGAPFGKWSTNDTNQLVITKPDASTVALDVVWKFNPDNHLVVQANGADVFDFSQAGPSKPFFKTEDALLKVFPDVNKAFQFTLKGDWALDKNHHLTLTVSGTTSTIVGFIQDPRGRFMYHFFDQRDLARESVLGFAGAWESVTSADGKPMVKFAYQRKNQPAGVFELPAAVTVNRSTNQFMYEYDDKGKKRRLQFVGELRLNENFEISYILDRQVSQTGQELVASTTFRLAAVFRRNDFTGEMELAVKKADGTPGTTLVIGGNFTGMLGTTQLTVAFAFSQTRNGAVVTTTVGCNGALLFKDNGEVTWEFQRNAAQMSININAHIQLGDARIDGRLNLVSAGGRVVGVRALFGVAF